MTDILLVGGITKKKSSMGIGNRIGGLISGIRLSIFYNCDFYIEWVPIPSLYLSYKDIIENINIGSRKVTINQKIPGKRFLRKSKWRIDLLPSELELPFFKSKNKDSPNILDIKSHKNISLDKRDAEIAEWYRLAALENNIQITGNYDKNPPETLKSIIQSVKCIQFKSDLIEKIDHFLNSNFFVNKTIVGVSIRSWPDCSSRRKSYHLNHYISRLRKYSHDNVFFVSGDCQKEINKLKKRFPNRILEYPRITSRGRIINNKETHLEDFIDFLILSRCQVLIGHFLSSYIEMAWFCGLCRGKLDLVYEAFHNDMKTEMPDIKWDS